MDKYVAKRGRRIEERVGDIEAIAAALTAPDQEAAHLEYTQLKAVAALGRMQRQLQSEADEVARLRQLLIEYGRHGEGCGGAFGKDLRCRCGWRDEAAILGINEP